MSRYLPPNQPVGPPPTNSLATVSLVAGIASFVIVPLIGALVAVITGHRARAQIRQTGESGFGLATAGLVLGYIHLALVGLAVVVVILVVLFFASLLGRSGGT